MTVLQKAKSTIERNNLLSKGDSVLIGLSGGPDSVALLRVLVSLRNKMKLLMAAVYINHQLRPRAAAKEEQFCQELCHKYAIDVTLVSEDIKGLAQKRKLSVEEAAREFRYGLYEFIADEDGHDHVALGHHADDQVETILFRILRGTGTEGLTGMPVKRGRIIRPLIDVTKADIRQYLKRLNQPYCEDRSNRDTAYTRNFVRHHLLPQIREKINPQVDRALLTLSEIAEKENHFLDQIVSKALEKSVRITPGGKLCLALREFRGYDEWARRKMLRRCARALSAGYQPPPREAVDRLEQLAAGKLKAVSLPGSIGAVITGQELVLFYRKRHSVRMAIEIGHRTELDWPGLVFQTRIVAGPTGPITRSRRSSRVRCDWSKIEPPLVVRSIRPGDRFRPLGMSGSKKVGDYLTDKKLPKIFRDETVLVCDRGGIVWVVGFEIDDRVKLTETTGKVLSIEYRPREQSSSETI